MSMLKVNIWKKGTDKHTSMPDYQIEIDQGETYPISAMVNAINAIAQAMEKEER